MRLKVWLMSKSSPTCASVPVRKASPNVVVYPEKSWYAHVKTEDLDDIVAHLAGGPHVQRLDTIDSSLKELIYQLLDTGVF